MSLEWQSPPHTLIARTKATSSPESSQSLVAFGHHHIANPEDPVLTTLKERFQMYLDLTAMHPHARVVMLETSRLFDPQPNHLSDMDLIGRNGREQLALSEWALRNNIWRVRLEPQIGLVIPDPDNHIHEPPPVPPDIIQNPEFGILFASQRVSLDGIKTYYAGRLFPQMISIGITERSSVKEFIDSWFEHFCSGWASILFDISSLNLTFEGFLQSYRRIYGHELTFPLTDGHAAFMLYETCGCLYPEHYPQGISKSEVGIAAEIVNDIRDREAWRIIQRMWRKGWSPFLAPGEAHVRALGALGMDKLGTPVELA